MKKSGILMIAAILAAGISPVSAADINFDGARGLGSRSTRGVISQYLSQESCVAMFCPTPEGMSPLEWDECSCRPINIEILPAIQDPGAPFMNEQACSILDANFLVQPSMEEAAGLLNPCLSALSARYGAPLKLVTGEKGLNLLVGNAKNPGVELRDALRVQLKAKANGRFFGHKVALYVPSVRVPANKGWVDDYNTVVEYIEDETAIDGAFAGAAIGSVVGGPAGGAAIVVGAVIGAVVDAWDD